MIVLLQGWKENASFIPLTRKEVFGCRSAGLSWAAQMAAADLNNTVLSLLVLLNEKIFILSGICSIFPVFNFTVIILFKNHFLRGDF